jgi:hypothetical protein
VTNVTSTEVTCSFDLSGAATGSWKVEVMNDDGQVSTGTVYFTVTRTEAPGLGSISPGEGAVGDSVTLIGTGFGNTRAGSVVSFNGTDAVGYTDWSENSITCLVPSGATTGDVMVKTVAGWSNTKPFTVTQTAPVDSGPKATWYLAEGTTDYGFVTYITILNPNPTPVTALVTYMTKSGPRSKAAITLPGRSQTVVNPADDVGATDFSTRVVCHEGKTIAVDRRMIWTGPGAPSSEGHSSIGVTAPSRTWYLAEGSSNWGFECWLLIQNPGSSVAHCKVTYMIEGAGPQVVNHDVPANSRASFNMGDDIGANDASIKVEANVPVIPERSMYRNDRREGHNSIGTTTPATDYYLAEGTTAWGFTTYVLVQNPNSLPNTVSITYMTQQGPVSQEPFTVEANSRSTLKVNDVVPSQDLSIHVGGSLPLIAERSMYWENETGQVCHDSIGMDAPHTTFYLPDGETTNGYETWTLVQNPNNSAVQVEISYLTPTGTGNVTWTETVPANSRKSYSMADKTPQGRAAIMVTCKTPGKKIMVERSMYWNNRGAGTVTIGGYAN